jgi:biopolymer transport protein ExbD
VIVREGRIEVGDRNIGALGVYPKTSAGYDYEALSAKLSEIKRSYPQKTDAAILLESDIPYDTLVQVMDRVRVEEKVEDRKVLRHDLFPDISIGDAPATDGA